MSLKPHKPMATAVQALGQRWQTLSPREQGLLSWGATLLAVALVWCLAALGLVVWAQESWQCMVPAELSTYFEAGLLGALAASALAFVWMGRWFAKRLQGFTGDCLGATQQVCERAFYLGFLLAWGSLA